MTIFKCDRCGYRTTRKSNFEIHLNRRIPCHPDKMNKKIRESLETFCNICEKNFSREDSLLRHMKMFHDGENLDIGNDPDMEQDTTTKRKKYRYISNSTERKLLRKQNFCCANSPGSNLYNIDDYECTLWKLSEGKFDRAGYEIDHVIDYCLTGDNDIDNLQILCPSCHKVKTYNSRASNKKIRHPTKSKSYNKLK